MQQTTSLFYSVWSILFLITTNISFAQKSNTIDRNGIYRYYEKQTGTLYQLHWYQDSLFEFQSDNKYDCSSMYIQYGKGKILLFDSLAVLQYDSIPYRLSSHKIDSVANLDDQINLNIQVIDDHQLPIEGVVLSWNCQYIKGRVVKNNFSSRNFDAHISLIYPPEKKIYFLKIAAAGYYAEDIDLSKIESKDYTITITLRPKSSVKAHYFISNQQYWIGLPTACQLYFWGLLFKKEDCTTK